MLLAFCCCVWHCRPCAAGLLPLGLLHCGSVTGGCGVSVFVGCSMSVPSSRASRASRGVVPARVLPVRSLLSCLVAPPSVFSPGSLAAVRLLVVSSLFPSFPRVLRGSLRSTRFARCRTAESSLFLCGVALSLRASCLPRPACQLVGGVRFLRGAAVYRVLCRLLSLACVRICASLSSLRSACVRLLGSVALSGPVSPFLVLSASGVVRFHLLVLFRGMCCSRPCGLAWSLYAPPVVPVLASGVPVALWSVP